VTLTGTNVAGNAVNLTTFTNASGIYDFTGLPSRRRQRLHGRQDAAAGLHRQPQTVGTVGGSNDGALPPGGFDAIDTVALAAGQSGVGLQLPAKCCVQPGRLRLFRRQRQRHSG